jgi:hypothetical protein
MKKSCILLTIALTLLTACGQKSKTESQAEGMYTLKKGKIGVNEKYRAHNQLYDTNIDTIASKLVDTFAFTVGEESYEVKYYKLTGNGWDGEAGDFYFINLFHNGKQILEHIDLDGFCELGSDADWTFELKPLSSIPNKYAIVCPLRQGVTALIFDGYVYASQPPKMPIVVMKGDQAAVVQNLNIDIEKFSLKDGLLDVTFVDSYPEYWEDENGNEKSNSSARRYRITSTPKGTLTFEQVEDKP